MVQHISRGILLEQLGSAEEMSLFGYAFQMCQTMCILAMHVLDGTLAGLNYKDDRHRKYVVPHSEPEPGRLHEKVT